MVLTHTTQYTYAHPFPTVTLAYFLRYSSAALNPFAAHVLSTDTLSSHIDPETGRLTTVRVHLKKSRMPRAIFQLLPQSITGGGPSMGSTLAGDRASYILETSVVDMREGWMRTESRNLNFTGVLEVIERQMYRSPMPSMSVGPSAARPATPTTTTEVETSVLFRSRLGERFRRRTATPNTQTSSTPHPEPSTTSQMQSEPTTGAQTPRPWAITSWLGAGGIQRTIESIASRKTADQLGRSREGMRVVLERLRAKGVVGVLVEIQRRRRDGGREGEVV